MILAMGACVMAWWTISLLLCRCHLLDELACIESVVLLVLDHVARARLEDMMMPGK